MLHVPEIRNIVDKNPFHICSDASEDNFFFFLQPIVHECMELVSNKQEKKKIYYILLFQKESGMKIIYYFNHVAIYIFAVVYSV